MKFHFVYNGNMFLSLKEVYASHGDAGYSQARLLVPQPDTFLPAETSAFRAVMTNGLRTMAREYSSSQIVIAYSGGIDSECIAVACLDAGIHPHLRTAAWRSNQYDVEHAREFARRVGVRHDVIEIDMAEYLREDLYEWVWGAECAAEIYFSAEKALIDGLADDEVLLLGAGAPPNVQRRDSDGKWVLRHPLVDPASYYQYARYRQKSIWCPYVDDAVTRATWTSVVLNVLNASGKRYFEDIWQYGSERTVCEYEWRQAKGLLYSSFPELRYRRKYHGWETELTPELFRAANKRTMERYFERCLKAGRPLHPAVDVPEIESVPENPFYKQAMGDIVWIEHGVSPLDRYTDWDLSDWV